MRRLLIKELRSAWWVIVLAYATTLLLMLLGDPLMFRGDSSASSSWLIVPFLVLGIRAYSGEMGANTVEFLYSRPIKWWQVLLAKLIVGISAIVSTALLGLLLYVLTAPRYYMPFLHEELLSGLGEMVGVWGAAFGLGLAVSALMPGIALSFIALIGIAMALGVAASALDWIGKVFLISWLKNAETAVTFSAAVGLIAPILIIRKLPKLGVTQRWAVMGRFLAAGLALGLILAALGIPKEGPSTPFPMSLSPDGRFALYAKDAYDPQGKLALVETRTGNVQLIVQVKGPQYFTWSPDSRKVAFTSDDGNLAIITVAPKPESWTARKLGGQDVMAWSPDSRLLAVVHYDGTVGVRQDSFLVNPAAKTIRPMKFKKLDHYEDVVPGNDPVFIKGHGLFWPPVVQ